MQRFNKASIAAISGAIATALAVTLGLTAEVQGAIATVIDDDFCMACAEQRSGQVSKWKSTAVLQRIDGSAMFVLKQTLSYVSRSNFVYSVARISH